MAMTIPNYRVRMHAYLWSLREYGDYDHRHNCYFIDGSVFREPGADDDVSMGHREELRGAVGCIVKENGCYQIYYYTGNYLGARRMFELY